MLFLEGDRIEPGAEPETALEASSDQARRLHEELRQTQERLRASRSDHDNAMHDLRTANEELQSVNEEYRSTAEELETSKEELQSMNEELRAVNTELEAKLDSISTSHDDLQNIVTATEIGTLFLDPKLRIKLFTPEVARVFNIAASDIGRAITDFTHTLDYDGLEDDAAGVARDLAPREVEVATRTGRWLLVRLRPYRTFDDHIDGVVISFVDVTERRRSESRLREAHEQLAMATAASNLGWKLWDTRTGDTTWDARGRDILGLSPAQNGSDDWLARVHPEDRPRIAALATDRADGDAAFAVEYRVMLGDGAVRHVLESGMFERDETGEPLRASGLLRDVTDRKTWEAAHLLPIGELNHRMKNMLAVVLSIAAQTQRSSSTLEVFAESFRQRFLALATAHNLLIQQSWGRTDLGTLVRATLASFLGDGQDRVRVDGPPVTLLPSATLSLTMALHELATNAVKYGALWNETGHVDLTWRAEGAGAARRFALFWQESGGPEVTPPTRKGFGSRLLERGVARELDGAVGLDYAREGLRCRMEFPVDGAIQIS